MMGHYNWVWPPERKYMERNEGTRCAMWSDTIPKEVVIEHKMPSSADLRRRLEEVFAREEPLGASHVHLPSPPESTP
jgi:hypothetical protein